MTKELFHISLTRNEIAAPEIACNPTRGARVAFSGIVRDSENGEPIDGILYSAYEEMAQPLLEEMAAAGRRRFPKHGLWLEHRLGFVPAGEPSVHILVTTPHSAEAFEISRWYLDQVKTRLPIWKEPHAAKSDHSSLKFTS